MVHRQFGIRNNECIYVLNAVRCFSVGTRPSWNVFGAFPRPTCTCSDCPPEVTMSFFLVVQSPWVVHSWKQLLSSTSDCLRWASRHFLLVLVFRTQTTMDMSCSSMSLWSKGMWVHFFVEFHQPFHQTFQTCSSLPHVSWSEGWLLF